VADPRKKYIALPRDREITREEGLEIGRQLFDTINADRSAEPRA
jgi:hypothetical protein